jgi:type III secretory pathway component EscT
MPLPTPAISVDSWVFTLTGLKLTTLLISWARALPVVVIVPAFGSPRAPASLRSAIALALTLAAFPGTIDAPEGPSMAQLTLAVIDGITLAVPAALGIWIATMAGDLFDEFGGKVGPPFGSQPFEHSSTATGTLFGLIACIAFLAQGGVAKLAAAMTEPLGTTSLGLARLLQTLTAGIGLSVTLAAPLVVAQLIIQLGGLLASRVTSTDALRTLSVQVQGLLRLLVIAVFFEWVATMIASRY